MFSTHLNLNIRYISHIALRIQNYPEISGPDGIGSLNSILGKGERILRVGSFPQGSERNHHLDMGVSFNGGTIPQSPPQRAPKWSFLVGKPVGLLGKPTIWENPHIHVPLGPTPPKHTLSLRHHPYPASRISVAKIPHVSNVAGPVGAGCWMTDGWNNNMPLSPAKKNTSTKLRGWESFKVVPFIWLCCYLLWWSRCANLEQFLF